MLAATVGTDGGGRRSALEAPNSSRVSSTFGMSNEISLVRANNISKEIKINHVEKEFIESKHV